MIPKLIHQTAKTAEVPEKWRPYQKTVQELHPDWTYKLWTDEDNLAFVTKEFPDFLDTYLKLPKNIMRADVIRYLLLYRLGGLYMDMDYEMLKPFDLNEHECMLCWESNGEFGPGNDKLAKAIMASAPGHPFFKLVIDELKAHPPLADDADVEASTGPALITRLFREKAQSSDWKIFTPPHGVFIPFIPQNRRQYDALVAKGVAYGIHYCTGTWREYSFPRRMRARMGKGLRRVLGQGRVEGTIRRYPVLARLLGIRR